MAIANSISPALGPQSSPQVRCDLDKLVKSRYPHHSFETEVEKENVRKVMERYLAMSQAFPYLQAGASKDIFFRCLDDGQEIDDAIEITTAVGAFLVADETGINCVLARGIQALPEILGTRAIFHANLLRKDLHLLFRTDINPNYDPVTQAYLKRLFVGLASVDQALRCAEMVAFEAHAGRMIGALWGSLEAIFPQVDKNELEYFRVHVGENGAEPFHQEMTACMIEMLVPTSDLGRFFAAFDNAYRRNIDWCAAICE